MMANQCLHHGVTGSNQEEILMNLTGVQMMAEKSKFGMIDIVQGEPEKLWPKPLLEYS